MLHRLLVTLGVLAMSIGGGAALAAPPSKPNTLTAQERKAGWRLLFDGKSTKGWRGFRKPEPPAGWQVQDGLLVRADKGGDIMTVDQFGDFELTLEWRMSQNGNSGVIYRATEDENTPWKTGPEYQLLDDAGHPDAKAGKDGNHRAGSLYDVYPPAKDVVKPAGEWNSTRIVARGNKIEHWLNGEKVVDAEIGSADWNARVAGSKWAKISPDKFAQMPRGHIALQDHGDLVEFRNIKIRVLDAPARKMAKQAK